jgi:hypothetical protein
MSGRSPSNVFVSLPNRDNGPVLLAYIDETSNAVHYRTTALIVEEAAVLRLTSALDDVVAAVAHEHGDISEYAELHGHDLLHATEEWAPLKEQVRARIAIYRRALAAVGEHASQVYIEGLSRPGFQARYSGEGRDEHQTCLLHLLEKVNGYARLHRQNLVVVADEHHTALATQDAVRRMRVEPVWGFRGRPDRLIDTVYFVSSAMSRPPVQAADMVAFIYQRMTDAPATTDTRATRANADLWGTLTAKVQVRERLWTPGEARQPPPGGGG